MRSKSSSKLPLYPDARYADQVLALYRNYVNHARILHAVGRPVYYRRMDRLAALEKCQSYLRCFAGRNKDVICRMIPSIKKELEIILPVPSNLSYEASRRRLSYLLILCEKVNQKNSLKQNIKHET